MRTMYFEMLKREIFSGHATWTEIIGFAELWERLNRVTIQNWTLERLFL